jgi:putative membrane protein
MLILAHVGESLAPHDVLGAWNFNPLIVAAVVGTWWLYRRGARGLGRVDASQQSMFGLGLTFVAVAMLSPLDAMGGVLASAHMVQHLLLMMVAAPLIALGRPGEILVLGIPRGGRKRLGRLRRTLRLTPSLTRRIAHPGLVWFAFAGVFWVWHFPVLYEAALTSDLVHALEHLSFLAVAVPFWAMVLRAPARMRGLAVLAIFAAALQGTVLAALLTFSRSSWYPFYQATVPAWGLTPLEDQQLAGVIMWVAGGLLYLAAGLTLFASWIAASGQSNAVSPIGVPPDSGPPT